MADKTVAVIIPGADEDSTLREVTIKEGSTAQDVLNELGRGTGFILATTSGKVFRNAKELVFSAIKEDDKLAITPHAAAGASTAPGFIKALSRKITGVAPSTQTNRDYTPTAAGKPPPLVVKPSQPIMVRPSRPIIIAPKIQPAWKEKGWQESSPGIYEGKFHCPFGSYKGRIEFNGHGFQHTYIWHPPREIWNYHHPHSICFHRVDRRPGKFEIHMNDKPSSVDCAILNTERILNEAFALGAKRG